MMRGVVLALGSLLVLHVARRPLPVALSAFEHESIPYLFDVLQVFAMDAPLGSPEKASQHAILQDI